mmetsp:Transcript_50058/g.165745  ORF Transcript_50058/g.165745 Transcript_50058/m.165745 type:complete len:234 (+) Transcript_50058:1156-1857(+)
MDQPAELRPLLHRDVHVHAHLHRRHPHHRRLLLELYRRRLVRDPLRRALDGSGLGRAQQHGPAARGLAALPRGVRRVGPCLPEPSAVRRRPPPRRRQLGAGRARGQEERRRKAGEGQGARGHAWRAARLGGGVVRLPGLLGVRLGVELPLEDALPAGGRRHGQRRADRRYVPLDGGVRPHPLGPLLRRAGGAPPFRRPQQPQAGRGARPRVRLRGGRVPRLGRAGKTAKKAAR